MSEHLINLWRSIVLGDQKSWVMFENGTCLILMEPETDLGKQALAVMAEWGPVHAGGPPGDFGVIHLEGQPGWVVTGHHPDMLNYVGPDEVSENPEDLEIGMLGRSIRNTDGLAPKVVHIEDKRDTGT